MVIGGFLISLAEISQAQNRSEFIITEIKVYDGLESDEPNPDKTREMSEEFIGETLIVNHLENRQVNISLADPSENSIDYTLDRSFAGSDIYGDVYRYEEVSNGEVTFEMVFEIIAIMDIVMAYLYVDDYEHDEFVSMTLDYKN